MMVFKTLSDAGPVWCRRPNRNCSVHKCETKIFLFCSWVSKTEIIYKEEFSLFQTKDSACFHETLVKRYGTTSFALCFGEKLNHKVRNNRSQLTAWGYGCQPAGPFQFFFCMHVHTYFDGVWQSLFQQQQQWWYGRILSTWILWIKWLKAKIVPTMI